MYRYFRNGAVVCLLSAAAAATWYWSRPAPPDESAAAQPSAAPSGYYLRDAVVLGLGDDGSVIHRVFAELVEERPEDQRLVLTDLRFEYQPDEHIPWTVSAARAEAPADLAYLQLEGDVELARAADEDSGRILVETESLLLTPEQHLASAAGPVSVTVGGNTLHAVGLEAFLKDDRLELEKSVRGRFVP